MKIPIDLITNSAPSGFQLNLKERKKKFPQSNKSITARMEPTKTEHVSEAISKALLSVHWPHSRAQPHLPYSGAR
jgi:hypothetical protein